MPYADCMYRSLINTDKHINKHIIFILLLLVCMTGMHRFLEAEDIIQHRYTTDKKDAQLEDILYLTIGVQLADAGFSSTRTLDGARYALEIAYSSRGTAADIILSLFTSTDKQTPLAKTTFLLPIDYSIDATIAGEVDRLLELAALDDVSKQDPSQVSAIQGLFSKSLGREMSPDEILAATALRIDVSFGLGGTVFFSDMTEFFHYGAGGTFAAGFRKPWKKWSLSVGTRFTSSRVFNDSGVTGGPLYLSTAGLDLQAGTGYSRFFRLSGGVSGGAAVISVAGGTKTLHKTVPYADVGANLQLPVGKGFFVGLDIRNLLVFDEDLLIMGLVPVLSMGKEFY